MADQQKRQWGVTNPISEAQPTETDLKLNDQLLDYLKAKNNFESPEATDRRRKVLAHIQKVAEEFIKRAGRAKNLPQSTVDSLGGKVFTYGSFSLGVYGPTSDIDTLIVAPKHVLIEDFFAIFPQTFKEMTDMSEVTEFVPVEDAYVPIIKMEYRQVSVDLIFASLPTQSTIPRNFELVGDIQVLRGLDETEMRSVNGPRVTKELLENIPQPKSFRYALRAIKLWSNQRGIYGAVFGYPGGIAWAIMVARISQLYPYACGATIVSKFFNLMRKWHWPRPVMLKDVGHTTDNRNPLNLRYWNPTVYGGDRAHIMPVVTPAYPQMCATHSITHSTFNVMMHEFERADEIMASIQAGRKSWDDLFVRHTFFTEDHKYYLSVVATSTTKDAHEIFKGIVQSKVRLLSKYIEEGQGGVDCARPYMKATERMHRVTTEDQIEKVRKGLVDYQIKTDEVPKDADPTSNGDGPKIIHTATFYIGLKLTEADTKSLDISWPVQEFRRLVTEAARYETDTMDLRVVHTRNTHLPADVFVEGEIRPTKPAKEKKKKTNGTTSKASKRQFGETGMEDSEKISKKRASEANGIQAAVPA